MSPFEPETPQSGTTYYVATNGADANDGSSGHPWLTLGYASRILQPGDTLIIKGGSYVIDSDALYWLNGVMINEMITPPSGTVGNWIVIKGEDGNRPIIKGGGNISKIVDLQNVNYLKIENIEFTHDDGALVIDCIDGIWAAQNNIVLKNLYIHHVDQYGVNLRTINQLYILNCRIEYCGWGAVGGPSAEATGGWENILIKDSTLSYSGRYYQGIFDNPDNPYSRPDGFGIEPGNGPVEICNVTVEGNNGDGLDSKTPNTYIHDCNVINNRCEGVKLWGNNSRIYNTLIKGFAMEWDGVTPSGFWCGIVITNENYIGARYEVVNVTLYDTATRPNYSAAFQYDYDTPTTVVMKNNIFVNGGRAVFVKASTTLEAENNIFRRDPGTAGPEIYANGREYYAAEIDELGAGNMSSAPIFVNTAADNYRLQAGSPGVDQGTSSLALDHDLDGNARPQGTGYDIGAYER